MRSTFLGRFLFVLIFQIFFCSWSKSQTVNTITIGVTAHSRHDSYPQITSNPGGRPASDYINLSGTSRGIDIDGRLYLPKKFFVTVGLGYFRLRFSNVSHTNDIFPGGPSRMTTIPLTIFFPFYSDYYHYNLINLNVGIGKSFIISRSFQADLGATAVNYFSISQFYQHHKGPTSTIQDVNKRHTGHQGTNLNIDFGLLYSFAKFKVGPKAYVPLRSWQATDPTFPEEGYDVYRMRKFRSFGYGISFLYKL